MKTPRQPWVSPSTWATLKYAAPLRRSLQLLRSIHRGALVRTTWVAWRSRLHGPFIPGDEGILTAAKPGLRGWAARACLPELHHTAMRLRHLTAAPQYTLCLLHVAVKVRVLEGKRVVVVRHGISCSACCISRRQPVCVQNRPPIPRVQNPAVEIDLVD